jgi:hypothetical protein
MPDDINYPEILSIKSYGIPTLYELTTLAAFAGRPPLRYNVIAVWKSPSLSLTSAAFAS